MACIRNTQPCFPCSRTLSNLFNKLFFKLIFRSDYTVNRFLLNLFDPKVPPCSSTPSNGISSTDITNIFADLWARVYVPDLKCSDSKQQLPLLPIIVFFHGGGFTYGSADSLPIDTFSHDLAKELGYVVVSVNYRLAPEHRFPTQYDDALQVLKAIDKLGVLPLPCNVDLSQCFIVGESSGGNIVHHVAVRLGKSETKFKRLRIRGLVAIQPFFGGENRTRSELRYGKGGFGLTLEMTDWFWKAFLPVGSNRDHSAANVVLSESGPGLDYPPSLVFIGGLDPLKDRIKEYCEWLVRSGKEVRVVKYPNALHAFTWNFKAHEYSMMIQEVKLFTNMLANSDMLAKVTIT